MTSFIARLLTGEELQFVDQDGELIFPADADAFSTPNESSCVAQPKHTILSNSYNKSLTGYRRLIRNLRMSSIIQQGFLMFTTRNKTASARSQPP